MVLILVIGIFPEPFFARISPAVAITNQNLQAQRAAIQAAPPVEPEEAPAVATATPPEAVRPLGAH